MNIVFISADDMSYNSTGMSGNNLKDLTPTLDWLGENGAFFKNAHTTVGLCQPSRSVWMTGLYPWENGATGFDPVFNHVTTLVDLLFKQYSTGIIGKAEHLTPEKRFPWNFRVNGYNKFCQNGKSPKKFYELTKSFLQTTTKPFFLMVNSHYPHRPFPKKSRFSSSEIQVPGFLPDTKETREELSLYYEAVRGCDDTVGLILKALDETKNLDDTLIIFTSDHGMAFPFVKANCYHFSTKVPLIWYYPKVIQPKLVDTFVTGVDVMPTILNFIQGIKSIPKMQGSSYKDTLINGSNFKNEAFTCLCKLYFGNNFETRAIHNKEYCYIVNYWSNGKNQFVEDGCEDIMPSMKSIMRHRPRDYKKIRFRSPEELYDVQADPFARNNLIGKNNGAYKKMKSLLYKYAIETNDKLTLSQLFKNKLL